MLSTRISCELEVCIYSLLPVFQIEILRQRRSKLALCEAKQEGAPGTAEFWLLLCQRKIHHEANEVQASGPFRDLGKDLSNVFTWSYAFA